MSDYRPIETAPRDGTEIEVMHEDVGSFIVRWNPMRETFWSRAGGIGLWECPGGNFTWSEHDGDGPDWWLPVRDAEVTTRVQ